MRLDLVEGKEIVDVYIQSINVAAYVVEQPLLVGTKPSGHAGAYGSDPKPQSGQRRTQVVRSRCYELREGLVLYLAPPLILVGFQLECYQLGEQMKEIESILAEVCRLSIKSTQSAKVATILPVQRHRYVALYAMKAQPQVVAEARVGAGLVDEERCDRTADDASVGRLQLQLVARLQTEPGFVQDGTGSPGLFGNACHQCNAQPGGAAQHPQDNLNGFQPADRRNIEARFRPGFSMHNVPRS